MKDFKAVAIKMAGERMADKYNICLMVNYLHCE